MKPSLKGHLLPESEADFGRLLQMKVGPKYLCCLECSKPFSKDNVHTVEGWRETQISGACEDCFDELFEEDA